MLVVVRWLWPASARTGRGDDAPGEASCIRLLLCWMDALESGRAAARRATCDGSFARTVRYFVDGRKGIQYPGHGGLCGQLPD